MRYIPYVLFALLVGCATASETATPSGARGYSIDCSGAAQSWSNCYKKAGEVCPAGYDVIAQNSDQTVLAGPYAYSAPVTRTLLVQCG